MRNTTGNYIKLYRSLMDWGWYKDGNTMRVFLHLLLIANFKPGEFLGKHIDRGQAVFGRKELSVALRLSEQNVRTALNHLVSTGELTLEPTSRFTVATVVNYERYQRANAAGDDVLSAPDVEAQSDKWNDQQSDQQINQQNVAL